MTGKRWKKTDRGREPLDSRMQAICAALQEGRTYREIAQEFGISIARVGQIRKYANLERRKTGRQGSRRGNDSTTGQHPRDTGTARTRSV